MSNDGLSTASFMQGAMQGYKFMEGVEDNKIRREENKKLSGLRDAEEARRVESHDANMAFNNSRMKKIEREELEAIDKQFWRNSFLAESGKLNDDERAKLNALTNGSRMANPEYLASDDVGFATDTYDKVRSGELDMNHPDAIRAANILVNVNRGAKDGRKLNLSRLVPSSGGGLHIGMDSTEADGTVRSNVPLTDGRSGDPKDTVAELSIDELDHYAGTVKQMRSAVMNPNVRKAMYMQYGFDKEAGEQKFTKEERDAKLGLINAQAEHYRDKSGGAGGANGATANMKDITYLKSIGVPEDEAVDRVYNRGESPSQSITSMATRIYEKSVDMDGKPTITMDQAAKEASAAYASSIRQTRKPEPKPNPKTTKDMPSAADLNGKTLRNDKTGVLYKSDGKNWVPVPKQEDPKPGASGDAGKKPEAQSEPAKPEAPKAEFRPRGGLYDPEPSPRNFAAHREWVARQEELQRKAKLLHNASRVTVASTRGGGTVSAPGLSDAKLAYSGDANRK